MKYYRINNRIYAPKVRLIDENGQHLGEMETSKALALARERGYDLVEISPKENPPVAKLLDFGQFKYELRKKEKESKVKQKIGQMKGIRISYKSGRHDLEFKANRAKKFLEENSKVKIEMILRGREKAHPEKVKEIFDKFVNLIGQEKITIEQPFKKQGGQISMIIS